MIRTNKCSIVIPSYVSYKQVTRRRVLLDNVLVIHHLEKGDLPYH